MHIFGMLTITLLYNHNESVAAAHDHLNLTNSLNFTSERKEKKRIIKNKQILLLGGLHQYLEECLDWRVENKSVKRLERARSTQEVCD